MADFIRRIGEGTFRFVSWVGVSWVGQKTSRFINWLFMIDEFLASAPGRKFERKVLMPVVIWLDRLLSLSRWSRNR